MQLDLPILELEAADVEFRVDAGHLALFFDQLSFVKVEICLSCEFVCSLLCFFVNHATGFTVLKCLGRDSC